MQKVREPSANYIYSYTEIHQCIQKMKKKKRSIFLPNFTRIGRIILPEFGIRNSLCIHIHIYKYWIILKNDCVSDETIVPKHERKEEQKNNWDEKRVILFSSIIECYLCAEFSLCNKANACRRNGNPRCRIVLSIRIRESDDCERYQRSYVRGQWEGCE